jgi:initiation factor 1A
MPNIRGGKGYKSGKGKTKLGESEEVEFIEVQPDQMVGRLVRLLGDLNAMIYCQDNKQRICKICRSVKKSVRFEVGDIVLVSLRDCEVPKADLAKGVRGDRGDILDKFHSYQFSELKKMIIHTVPCQVAAAALPPSFTRAPCNCSPIDSRIFGNIETVSEISKLVGEGKEKEAEKVAAAAAAAEQDDLFDRDAEGEGDEDTDTSSDDNATDRDKRKKEGLVVDKKNKVSHRAVAAKKERELTLDDL